MVSNVAEYYLVIPGEAMPKVCIACPCLNWDPFEIDKPYMCNLTQTKFADAEKVKLSDCPLEAWTMSTMNEM